MLQKVNKKEEVVRWQHYMYMYGKMLQILLHIFTNMCYQLLKKKKNQILFIYDYVKIWVCLGIVYLTFYWKFFVENMLKVAFGIDLKNQFFLLFNLFLLLLMGLIALFGTINVSHCTISVSF